VWKIGFHDSQMLLVMTRWVGFLISSHPNFFPDFVMKDRDAVEATPTTFTLMEAKRTSKPNEIANYWKVLLPP
jgi:hypothetical protein